MPIKFLCLLKVYCKQIAGVFLLLKVSVITFSQEPGFKPPAPKTDRSINLSIEINTSIDSVWSRWLTPAGIQKFFAPASFIEPKPLGRYDIYFFPDAPAGKKGAENNFIMAMQEKQMLSFAWDAPPPAAEIRNQRTLVVLRFYKLGDNQTKLTLTQTGWGTGKDWDTVYNYFIDAWGATVLPFLKYSLEVKPVDWSNFPKNLPQGLKPATNSALISAMALDSQVLAQKSQTSHHIVIFRFQRQTFEKDATMEEEKTVKIHLQYLKDLQAEGKIVFAGFRKDAVDGIVVFETTSRDEALKLVQSDPAVKSRLFAWELHDFQTVLIRNAKSL